MNPAHPLTMFADFRNKLRKTLKCQPTADLQCMCERHGLGDEGTKRKECIQILETKGCDQWKAQWKEHYGWDVDESRDPYRWRQLQAELAAKKQAEAGKPPPDAK